MFRRKKQSKKISFSNLLGNAFRAMRGTLQPALDLEEYAKHNVFNRVSRNSNYGFYYFPYGYLFRYPKWGTINELGFRANENFDQVRHQFSDHVIIAIFGGSTAFSILVPDEQTFASKLETLLNGDNDLRHKCGKSFKVINFGQSGNVVLNQVLNYLLYAHVVQPEIVISHSGANDFVYGQINDRALLTKYNINYVDLLECWGRKLHDCDDVILDYDFSDPNSPDFTPVQPKNSPEDVVRAHHARVKQFAQIVAGFGAQFISGFQPWAVSKKEPSLLEREKIATYFPYLRLVYQNIPQLLAMYDDLLEKESLPYVVNLHRRFQLLDGQESHFADMLHTLEPGDAIIAQEYYKKVRSLWL